MEQEGLEVSRERLTSRPFLVYTLSATSSASQIINPEAIKEAVSENVRNTYSVLRKVRIHPYR